MLRSGRVKLSISSGEGKTLITDIAEAGEFLGESAVIADKPHAVTAETLECCQLDFVRRDDYLSSPREHGEACLRIARPSGDDYGTVYEHARQLLPSQSSGSRPGCFSGWGPRAAGRRRSGFASG